MDNKEAERLRWRCRRGKLEIDLFLVPFFESCYATLSDAEKMEFKHLLEKQDPDLHALLTLEQIPDSPAQEQLISNIREHRFTVSRHQFL